MRSLLSLTIVIGCLSVTPGLIAQQSESKAQFELTKAVLCTEVRGYRDFDRMAEPKLTRDDKLLIYCEPSGFSVERVKPDQGYRAHLTSSGRIRRRGKKEKLFERKDLLDYDVTAAFPPKRIYLKTSLQIKGLSPGDYEFDLIVNDALDETNSVTQVVPFTVIVSKPAPVPKAAKPPDRRD